MNVHDGQKRFAFERTWGAELTQKGAARFRMWAPGQHRLSLFAESTATEVPMQDRGDGWFEIFLGGAERPTNWLALPSGSSEIIVRCYFEHAEPAAADPNLRVPLSIEPVTPVGPPAPWDDHSVAQAWRRVAAFLRNRTLEQPKPGERQQPSWVSTT